MVEHSPVNRKVIGSSPIWEAFLLMSDRLLRNYIREKKYILLKNHKILYFTLYPFIPEIRYF